MERGKKPVSWRLYKPLQKKKRKYPQKHKNKLKISIHSYYMSLLSITYHSFPFHFTRIALTSQFNWKQNDIKIWIEIYKMNINKYESMNLSGYIHPMSCICPHLSICCRIQINDSFRIMTSSSLSLFLSLSFICPLSFSFKYLVTPYRVHAHLIF